MNKLADILLWILAFIASALIITSCEPAEASTVQYDRAYHYCESIGEQRLYFYIRSDYYEVVCSGDVNYTYRFPKN